MKQPMNNADLNPIENLKCIPHHHDCSGELEPI